MNAPYIGSESTNPLASTIFVLTRLSWERWEEVRRLSQEILANAEDSLGKDFAQWHISRTWGYLPRNFHFSAWRAKTKWIFFGANHDNIDGDTIGSFMLYNTYCWTAYNEFQSEKLGIVLAQIDGMPETGWSHGLRLEPLELSDKVTVSQLEDFLTSFIAYFLKKYNLSYKEIWVLEKTEEWYTYSTPDISNEYDESASNELLFGIRRWSQRETIYFSDLTPLHPYFIRELLLSLDNSFWS